MTGKERLTTLADYLDNEVRALVDQSMTKRAYFNMDIWATSFNNEKLPRTLKKVNECGFAACACGWAALCKPLVKDGFPVHKYTDRGHERMRFTWDELSKFFDLDEDVTVYLFGSRNNYAGDDAKELNDVIDNIRAAVQGTLVVTQVA